MEGAVLAGGDSRRFGSDKAEVRLGGEPLWHRQARILRGAGATRVAVVRRPGQAAPPGIDVRRDRFAGSGPMAGLHAALASASEPWVAVLAVDMPGIDAAWFRWLRGFCRPGMGAMVRHAESFEPLAAIYPAGSLSEITARLIRHERSLQRLAGALADSGRLSLVPLPAAALARVSSANTAGRLSAHAILGSIG